MNLQDSGALSVRAYSAAEAEPIPGALVRIRGAEELNRFVIRSLVTDRDGVTEKVTLPAPSRSYSLSPGSAEMPYAIYDIEISKDGFYTKRIFSVAVFSGINSVLPINMIPTGDYPSRTVFPHGNLNAIIKENEKLE